MCVHVKKGKEFRVPEANKGWKINKNDSFTLFITIWWLQFLHSHCSELRWILRKCGIHLWKLMFWIYKVWNPPEIWTFQNAEGLLQFQYTFAVRQNDHHSVSVEALVMLIPSRSWFSCFILELFHTLHPNKTLCSAQTTYPGKSPNQFNLSAMLACVISVFLTFHFHIYCFHFGVNFPHRC